MQAQRAKALDALALAQTRLQLDGQDDTAKEIGDLLTSFFGVTGGSSTTAAMDAVRGLSKDLHYREPSDPPWVPPDTSVRLYVLGPPRDETLLKKASVAASSPEVYGIDSSSTYMTFVVPALQAEDPDAPFDAMQVIPMTVAETMPFFRQRYWGSNVDPSGEGAAWRRIDTAWLDSAPELALQLDSATNNTSLVLAIELEGGDVLLFPGDAQIGNWLSWQTLTWTVDQKTVTGPDLLKRCFFYKVGHHGSHNATLKEHGLETMGKLQIAMVPVDHAMAVTKHWDRMPLPALIDALDAKTNNKVVRVDQQAPSMVPAVTDSNGLWYEVTL